MHLEQVQETPVLDQLWVDVIELCHTHRCSLAHVRVIILEAQEKRDLKVLYDAKGPQSLAPQCSHWSEELGIVTARLHCMPSSKLGDGAGSQLK